MRAVRHAQLEGELQRAVSRLNVRSAMERCIERLVQQPRHVKVQVLYDTMTPCTLSAIRHSTAAPRWSKKPLRPARRRPTRRDGAMRDRSGKACDCVGARTVEFLVDAFGNFLLEMNARLRWNAL